MADWDENENAYNADPEKYLANLEVELTQQREAQNLREATILTNPKWTRPRIGVRRDYSERYQRGFHQTFPPKAAKRPAIGTAVIDSHSQCTGQSQYQTAPAIFQNFQGVLTKSLKRGNVSDIPIPIIIQLAKSCIQTKDKKKEFAQLVFSEAPENIDEVEKYFVKVMTIAN